MRACVVLCVLCAVQEQQQLCAALQETKAFLEEQLADARARCSSAREVERDNLLLRQRIIDVEAVGVITRSDCGSVGLFDGNANFIWISCTCAFTVFE